MIGRRGALLAHHEAQLPALLEPQLYQAQYFHQESRLMRQAHRRLACPFIRVPQLEPLAMVLQRSAKK